MAAKKTAKKTAKRKRSKKITADGTEVELASPSPRNGNQLPLGNHRHNTGGKKGRSGRKPNWIRQRARDLVDQFHLLDVAALIAIGDIWEELWTQTGPVSGPTAIKDRLAAIKFLVEQGDGRPTIKLADADGDPLDLFSVEAHEAAVGQLLERLSRISDRQSKRKVPKKPRARRG